MGIEATKVEVKLWEGVRTGIRTMGSVFGCTEGSDRVDTIGWGSWISEVDSCVFWMLAIERSWNDGIVFIMYSRVIPMLMFCFLLNINKSAGS